ncbi:hypothetical protein Tco_1533288, partial [Tanacetum coccineum]
MGDANPIRTLGDYSRPSHEGYRNTIKLPEGKMNARGGIEEHLLADLTSLIDSVTLSNSGDRWVCDLSARKMFANLLRCDLAPLVLLAYEDGGLDPHAGPRSSERQVGRNIDTVSDDVYFPRNISSSGSHECSSSNNDRPVSIRDLTAAPVSPAGSMGTVGANGAAYARSGTLQNDSTKVTFQSKPKKSGASMGTISGMIGADYGSMNKDVEQFLLQMLGDGFKLDMEVIREVVGGCGYDIHQSLEKLMSMSASTLDLGDATASTMEQT